MESLRFQEKIEALWESGDPCETEVLHLILSGLDQGLLRVAEKKGDLWKVNSWLKKAILLYFKQTASSVQGDYTLPFYDKIPLKCTGWTAPDFEAHGFRLAPGALVRWGSFISPQCVIMPSFINTGVFIGEGTLIDSHVRVGSCAQVGRHCHLSDGVGIGGVLEPAQAQPVIIEDNCFIGARCQIVEGVLVGEGAVLGMGVTLGATTKIVHRETGAISYGVVPPYAVVVPGSLATPENPLLSVNCAVIVKQVDAQTRSKIALNELLRL